MTVPDSENHGVLDNETLIDRKIKALKNKIADSERRLEQKRILIRKREQKAMEKEMERQ